MGTGRDKRSEVAATGRPARKPSPTERYKALQESNRLWHSRVEGTVRKARSAARRRTAS